MPQALNFRQGRSELAHALGLLLELQMNSAGLAIWGAWVRDGMPDSWSLRLCCPIRQEKSRVREGTVDEIQVPARLSGRSRVGGVKSWEFKSSDDERCSPVSAYFPSAMSVLTVGYAIRICLRGCFERGTTRRGHQSTAIARCPKCTDLRTMVPDRFRRPLVRSTRRHLQECASEPSPWRIVHE
jgi:hypothetical protein